MNAGKKPAAAGRARRRNRGGARGGAARPRGQEAGRRAAAPLDAVLDAALIERGRVVVVGLGGIGSNLVYPVARFLAGLGRTPVAMVLIDGDEFEERNRERMDVPELGNKAVVICRELMRRYGRPGFHVRPIDRHITAENAAELIIERDLVLAGVDNHATRKILSDRCRTLRDGVLISGGNDGIEDHRRGTYGNVQVFRRRRGADLNPPLDAFHPEIRSPADRPPGPSCGGLPVASAPQISFTNLLAAGAMAIAFYRLLRADLKAPIYDEICFDILDGCMVPQRF